MNFRQFISNDKLRNTWVYERDIAIYVRRSTRYINNDFVPCLDIGSVGVTDKKQGRGIFTKFLSRFENGARKMKRAVFIESILNPQFYDFLKRKGYQTCPDSTELVPSVYKLSP